MSDAIVRVLVGAQREQGNMCKEAMGVTKEAVTAYCETCRAFTNVSLVNDEETLEIDGVTYRYPTIHGYCDVRGSEATPQPVLEDNQRSFANAVRAAHGIVSQEVVNGLVDRYNIKPRPLSSLLGWGEHTYSRFMEGDIPSKAFSDRINALWKSPLSYLLLLLSNGGALTSVALRKSRASAQKALTQYGSKADIVSAYLIGKTESNSALALQKELYYAQGLMLSFFGTPLIPERCEAWRMGPVFPEVWDRIKPREVDEEALINSDLDTCVRCTLSAEELLVLNAVAIYVGRYSPFVLRDITHSERPWTQARGSLPEDSPSNTEIDNEDIRSFFSDMRREYGMDRPADIARYMEKMVENLSAR